jgi:hypothetical protein
MVASHAAMNIGFRFFGGLAAILAGQTADNARLCKSRCATGWTKRSQFLNQSFSGAANVLHSSGIGESTHVGFDKRLARRG